ncbi:hypothetical protein ACEZCY_15505 [Streptacidiphilus sp. N1-12]|uniref:Uncharacterized protein n=2 Tax=Streptacidiphilus alkalitolerans TaxID=3342712 RepID=A0ABV6VB39_9ACTN
MFCIRLAKTAAVVALALGAVVLIPAAAVATPTAGVVSPTATANPNSMIWG